MDFSYYEDCQRNTTTYYVLLLLSSPLLWQLRILVWLVNDLLRPLPPLWTNGRTDGKVLDWGLLRWGEWRLYSYAQGEPKLNSNPLSYHVPLQTAMRSSQIGSNVVQHMRVEAGRETDSVLVFSYWVRSSTYTTLFSDGVGHLTLWGVTSSNCDGSCAVFVIWIGMHNMHCIFLSRWFHPWWSVIFGCCASCCS